MGGGKTGRIVAHLEQAGFTVRAVRLVRLTLAQAGASDELLAKGIPYDQLTAVL